MADRIDITITPAVAAPTVTIQEPAEVILNVQEPAEVILNVQEPAEVILNVQEPAEVILNVQEPAEVILNVQEVGIPGPPGPSGDFETVQASDNLGGDRAITADGLHCDGTSITDLNKFLGISLASAIMGTNVTVQKAGVHTIIGASFTPEIPIYVGPSGTLTQTATLPVKRIAYALTSTQILINPQPTIGT